MSKYARGQFVSVRIFENETGRHQSENKSLPESISEFKRRFVTAGQMKLPTRDDDIEVEVEVDFRFCSRLERENSMKAKRERLR